MEWLRRFGSWFGKYYKLILALVITLLIVFLVVYLVTRPNVNETVLGVVVGLAFASLTALINFLLGLQREQADREREMKLEEIRQKQQQRQELRAAYEDSISSLGNVVKYGDVDYAPIDRMHTALAKLSLFLPAGESDLSRYPIAFTEEVSKFDNAFDRLVGEGSRVYREMAFIVRDLSRNDPRLTDWG